ncbi:FecCD family ABC transporter permease [Streptosporangium carneum]|uniref:ABC transporter permease n=1 Tax=Streptosporangium carneum TaxID=47481 RepID=A0A9W6I6Q8_9ACTN|nr:iron chelate uptake ABC transporter family permease subunit [Streptosporangium carneum]GLK12712.1 ABC transporter permease [Streptosporangium carneum]
MNALKAVRRPRPATPRPAPGGRPGFTIGTPGRGVAFRVDRRAAVAGVALAVALAALTVFAIGTGQYQISPGDVLRALAGTGERAHMFVVETLRLPRALTALLVGAALGVAGAIFQSLTRNPLGSPDIVGFTTGAATGALIQIIVVGGGMAAVAGGALAGGLLTSLAVYLLAFRDGVHGYRLILVGIAINGGLVATNIYLVARAEFADAHVAVTWMTGNLNGRSWGHVHLLVAALAILLPVTLALGGKLKLMELGDEPATALGVPVERFRLLLMLLGVALTAMATVAAGPVPFVALAAPQLARRLTRATGPVLAVSCLMGALLLVAGDLAAQRLFAPTQLPVGVMTGSLGGVYLVWVLVSGWRRR